MITLGGNWKWDLSTDELFCSDVIFTFTDDSIIAVPKCLIHSEDLEELKRSLGAIKNRHEAISFRVITTYGDVKHVSAEGALTIEENESFILSLQQNKTNQYYKERQEKLQYEKSELELNAYRLAESFTKTGVWYMNTSTHEVYYSDQVYKIHGLIPQGVNAHLNSFAPYTHPQDRDALKEAFDQAYRMQVPLHVEYRILIGDDEERRVRQVTSWSFSSKGEVILNGTLEDITEEHQSESGLLHYKDALQLSDHVLNFAEGQKKFGHWYVHLLTRKIEYSKNVFRLYGIRNEGTALTPNILFKYVHPDDRDIVIESEQRIKDEHLPPNIEFRIIMADGNIRHLRQRGKLVVNAHQEMIMMVVVEDISDVVAASRKLSRLESQGWLLRSSFETAEDMSEMGSWVWDIQKDSITWSEGFHKLLGYKQGVLELTPQSIVKFIHPDDRKEFTNQVDLMLSGGIESTFVFRLSKKEKIQTIEARFNVVENNNARVFFAAFRNITQIHSLKNNLSDQQQFADMISDVTIDRVFVTDINNYILKWNVCCESAFGIKADRAIGRNLFEVFPEWKTPEILHDFHQVLRGEKITILDEQDLVAQKRYNRVMVPIRNADAEVTGVLNILRDVTREFELKRDITGRLRFIEKLLEASLDRIVVLDNGMNYLYWNKKAEEYYNLPKEEVLGKNILEVFPSFIDDPSFIEFKQALRGDTIHLQPKGLTEIPFDTYLIPLKDDKEMVTGILWITHDLTKDQALNRNKRKTTEILDALNDSYVELDSEFRFLYLNPKGEEFFGQPKEDIIGQVIWEVYPEMIGSDILQAVIDAVETKKKISAEFFSSVRKRWIHLSASPTAEGSILITFFDIQEIKEAHKKLEEEHRLMKEAQSIGHIGSFEWNLLTKDFFWSEEMHSIYEVESDTIPRKLESLLDYCHEDDRKDLEQAIHTVKAKGEAVSITCRTITAKGNERFISYQFTATLNDAGKPTHIRGTIQDITELVIFRDQVNEKDHFIRKIAESTPDIMTVFDLEKKQLLFINDGAAIMLGYSVEELKKMTHEERLIKLIHRDDAPYIEKIFKAVAAAPDDAIQTLEYRMTRADGTILWVSNRSRVFRRNAEGEAVQIISIVQDISEEKKHRQQLSDRAAFINNLINSSVDSIYVLDRDHNVLEWNQHCEEKYNVKRGAILGRNFFEFFPGIKENALFMDALQQAFKGTAGLLPPSRELYTNTICERFYIPLKHEDESVFAVLCTLHDVTTLQHARQELREANEALQFKNVELQQKNEEIAALAFVASHDLKEPLRKIHTFGNWLLERETEVLSDKGKDYLSRMTASVSRLGRLIDDILLLTRIHVDNRPAEKIDLNKVLTLVLQDLEIEVNEKKALITFDNLPHIIGVESQLCFLFKNIIQNALKFQREGNLPKISITATVLDEIPDSELTSVANSKFVKVSFLDNGIGFDTRYASKIFQVFQQLTVNDMKPHGTGIGLAICKKVMDMHKGFITVSSTQGSGSTFECYFPTE
ncbi:MAG TPA: PAS domain S-box protein [Chitinophagaceae bacterium]|nr:PAS domain S-box protein [Chitinophagaceae bacterium]